MDSDVQSVSGIFVFVHTGESTNPYKSEESKMTCTRDKIAAEEKSRKKRVPCFGFDKISYNARYTNIREVKKASFPGFRPFCISGIHLGLLGLWDALFTRWLHLMCFCVYSLYVLHFYICTCVHININKTRHGFARILLRAFHCGFI